MEFLRSLWMTEGWVIGALLGCLALALVAAPFVRGRLPSRWAWIVLHLCFAAVAAAVGWFAQPLLAEAFSALVPPRLERLVGLRFEEAGWLSLLLMSELVGVALAGRLVTPVSDGRGLGMASAMLVANRARPEAESVGGALCLVGSYLFPLVAAFLVSGWHRTPHPALHRTARAQRAPAEEGLGFGPRCVVALAATFAVAAVHVPLGIALLGRDGPWRRHSSFPSPSPGSR